MKKQVVILSQGCAANFGDGEQIARLFEQFGYQTFFQIPKNFSDFPFTPTAFCLNFCTVKGESTALQLLRKIKADFPQTRLLLTGCIPAHFKQLLQNDFPETFISNLETLYQRPQILQTLMDGEPKANRDLMEFSKRLPRTYAPGTTRAAAHIGILNISDGCLDACTFCSTRLVKGIHRSAAPEKILDEAQKYIAAGCKELWITGQDTSCYGFDLGTNLAQLAQLLLTKIPGDYKLRLGMGNPRHLLNYLEEMLETYQDDRVYKFIHLPVQSGSDFVLQKMGRKHNADTFYRLNDAFRSRFPSFTLSTDLIVGFPTETDADFEQTLKLLNETRPSICNITRFVPRPGTLAAKFNSQIPGKIQHERSAILSTAFQKIALENNTAQIGKTERVLTDKSGQRPGTFIAHDSAYRTIALKGSFQPGAWLDVEYKTAETFAIQAEILRS